jgi:hypothetical protein
VGSPDDPVMRGSPTRRRQSAAALRRDMVANLVIWGALRSDEVRSAFLAEPREGYIAAAGGARMHMGTSMVTSSATLADIYRPDAALAGHRDRRSWQPRELGSRGPRRAPRGAGQNRRVPSGPFRGNRSQEGRPRASPARTVCACLNVAVGPNQRHPGGAFRAGFGCLRPAQRPRTAPLAVHRVSQLDLLGSPTQEDRPVGPSRPDRRLQGTKSASRLPTPSSSAIA